MTDAIIAELEPGLKLWKRPWKTTGPGFPPRHNGQPYRGINTLVPWMTMTATGYGSPYFKTYKQAAALGAQVSRGAKATTVTYCDTIRRAEAKRDGTGEEYSIWFLRSHVVFNAGQIDRLASAILFDL